MTRTKSTYLALLAVLLSPMAAQADVINGGFETGDLTGWTVGGLSGIGSATVVTANTTTYSPGIWGTPVTTTPFEGSYMLAIGAGAANAWQEVSQSFSLVAGLTVSGSAFFDWGDYWNGGNQYPDGAKVEIYDSLGALIATPWYTDGTDYCITFCPNGTGQSGAESGWMPWSFTSGLSGNYTVVLGALNTADGGGPNQTFGYFDGVSATVPEPGTLALLGIGLFGMGMARRRKA